MTIYHQQLIRIGSSQPSAEQALKMTNPINMTGFVSGLGRAKARRFFFSGVSFYWNAYVNVTK
jgi:hypothetical protein